MFDCIFFVFAPFTQDGLYVRFDSPVYMRLMDVTNSWLLVSWMMARFSSLRTAVNSVRFVKLVIVY